MIFSIQTAFYKAIKASMKLGQILIPQPRPTVFSGPGSSIELAQTLGHLGYQRVLIVTDPMLPKLGLLDKITQTLDNAQVGWQIFDGVEPDPSFTIVEQGLTMTRSYNADAILAVGGGSSIDTAKVVSVRATNNKAIAKLAGNLKVRKRGLPLFAIPTTAGTGSEVTVAAVVSDPQTREKLAIVDPKVIPSAAALDPALMTGLPASITAATGMDALTHAVEAYVSTLATEETDDYARAAVKMIFNNLPKACANGDDLAARGAMATASFYAGLAFSQASLGYVHAIAHHFGAFYHTPHGLANAIVLPHILEFSQEAAAPKLAELAVTIGLGNASDPDRVLAQRFVEQVKTLCRELDIPETLDALEKKDIPAIVKGALKEAHYQYPVPKYMDAKQCSRLVEQMLTPA
ncbi:iron-containing alcohol dehydrogenase [Maricurvus nonylphenolicus]|uniref:iron-containing alcohol dehydrogenase n=1 Tax=Maricurvus nonylphenolicus TaxID=1008307 RepID=UPI0036F38E57